MESILIVGAGYVGLSLATAMAKHSHVSVVENNKEKLKALREGKNPIEKPGIALVGLSFFESVTDAMAHRACNIVFLCVGAPLKSGSGFVDDGRGVDESAIFEVANEIAGLDVPPQMLVIKSTVRPGLAKAVGIELQTRGCQTLVVSNPEFLSEGRALADMLDPRRVVFGVHETATEGFKNTLRSLYPWVRKRKILFMSHASAELTKLAANACLSAQVGLINEIGRLAHAKGAKMSDVEVALEMDERLGGHLKSGFGFGGFCLPKDAIILRSAASEEGMLMPVLQATSHSNVLQTEWIVGEIQRRVEESGACGAVFFGLGFKSGTSDERDSPVVASLEKCRESGMNVWAVRKLNDVPEENKNTGYVAVIGTKEGAKIFEKTKQNLRVIEIFDPSGVMRGSRR